jgi:MraZ protein
MSSFVGDILCKIDDKGRLSFPSVFKKQVSKQAQNRFVLKKDIFEDCIILYPYDEWEKQIEILRSRLNPYNRQHARFLRQFFKDTAEVGLDNNGRLLLPKRLTEQVGIGNEAYLVGLDSKIEIWSKENYERQGMKDEEFADLAQKLLGEDE